MTAWSVARARRSWRTQPARSGARTYVWRVMWSVLLAVVASAVAWPVYGRHAFTSSLEILAPLGAATTVAATAIAGRGRWLPGLRWRLAALAVLVAAQLAAGVALFAGLMFVSDHDAFFTALLAGYAGLIGLSAGSLLARRAIGDLDAVRLELARVGEGAREVKMRVAGADELAALARDVEAMVARIDAEERARRELVASVSHDLRTPITTLRLIAEGLQDDIFEPERIRDQLRLMTTHVRALSVLIDDLFELSRLQAGELNWSVEQVAIDELVAETIEAMRPQADAGGVAVRAELEERLTPARANPEQLQRVLFNLIQNAIRHTPADGTVVVRAERTAGPALEIEVADSGRGIDRADRERVFEPFVQLSPADRAAAANGSAGLGLAIARAIVEAHGGRIWLADAPGPGTHVRFTVPAV